MGQKVPWSPHGLAHRTKTGSSQKPNTAALWNGEADASPITSADEWIASYASRAY